ncbi:MAG TPA: GNAT family N-acetyltransferase [Rudaea sp.]|nr:GNAT family N-acetyltransferase [Rudaea sp.]
MRAPEFQTARLRMRTLSESDKALFCRLYTDAESMRFIGRPLSRARALAAFHVTLQSIREKNGGPCFFAIVPKAGKRAVGLCAIQPVARTAQRAEIGIMLAREGQGLRYGAEAISGLATTAFRALPIDRLWVQYHPANMAAKRLFARLSFLPEPRARPRGVRRGQCIGVTQRSVWGVTYLATKRG